ncbi:MAG: hypothetical protein CVU48_02840 [Candidatus Cloacimonetes bacterium HGW-Cloacimonetes-1]|nr:MAG: hypothetical protein CVU48_02840 [Candidatus Cloacimonetes bacterium HGW-Cloacimonetes-1]
MAQLRRFSQAITIDSKDKLLRASFEKLNDTPVESEIEVTQEEESVTTEKELRPHRSTKPFRPIILCILFILSWNFTAAYGQISGSITTTAEFSDNVFQLSAYDFDRYDHNHPYLAYVTTTDDVTMGTNINLAYPMHYKWWLIEPSIDANLSHNLSNSEKYRRDVSTRLKIKRYKWDASLRYAYAPHIYVRDYKDSDGTHALEDYSYERNQYRADLNIRPLKKGTALFTVRYEELYYNQYWKEYDGNSLTYGIGWNQDLPVFSLRGMYYYRVFDNDVIDDDSSYESNKYDIGMKLQRMPLSDLDPNGITWRPALSLSYEERFYQGLDSWYGGRIDMITTTNAGIDVFISDSWKFMLDYSHIFRNVDSPNSSVLRLKEYSENRLGAAVEYQF